MKRMSESRSSSMLFFNVFRIGSNDRAVVMIVGVRRFVLFVRHARIPDGLDALLQQPHHMAVGNLCRITF